MWIVVSNLSEEQEVAGTVDDQVRNGQRSPTKAARGSGGLGPSVPTAAHRSRSAQATTTWQFTY